jgi:hypothetical protein
MSTQTFNERETATVLAALRYWQQDWVQEIHDAAVEKRKPVADVGGSQFFASVEPLSPAEIDALCERINCPAQAMADQLFLFVTQEGDVECVSDSIRLPVVEIHEVSEDLLCDDEGVEDDAESDIVNRVIGPDGAKFSSHVWSVRPPVAWERAVIESWKQKQEKP